MGMGPEQITQRAAQVSRLLALRLGAKGAGLEARVAHRARALPRKVRRAALELAQAERLAQSPKQARQLDARALEAAFATCIRYLEPLGADERLRAAALTFGSSVAFIVIVVGGMIFGAMWLLTS
ncbi:hypothetical protein [uncultured Thioclava sp.]|uniref:hypothetical protein n=1 Tax=uncultured Thioclava sp. TaxID=473858 RepID=UPI0025D7D381|nr:hypothetical protein [uncultured Thioclava sp.]